jgi:hypothetical protein
VQEINYEKVWGIRKTVRKLIWGKLKEDQLKNSTSKDTWTIQKFMTYLETSVKRLKRKEQFWELETFVKQEFWKDFLKRLKV